MLTLYDQLSYAQGEDFEFTLSLKCKLKNVSRCVKFIYIYTEENNWLAPSTPQKVFVFPKTVCAVNKLL